MKIFINRYTKLWRLNYETYKKIVLSFSIILVLGGLLSACSSQTTKVEN